MTTHHPADLMTIAMSRLLQDGEVVFHGVASPMPMTAVILAKHTHSPNLIYLSIAGAVDGSPAVLPTETTTDNSLLENCVSYITLTDIFDLSARGKLDTAFLGGVQIDKKGQINMSVIGDFEKPKVRLPGGAGSAVVMPTAKQTILWRTKHDVKTFVDKLSFITASGNTAYVITPRCIFKREDGLLKVWRVFEGEDLATLAKETGFEIETAVDYKQFEIPTEQELKFLELIDPKGARYREFN